MKPGAKNNTLHSEKGIKWVVTDSNTKKQKTYLDKLGHVKADALSKSLLPSEVDIIRDDTLTSLASTRMAFLQYTSGSTSLPKGVTISLQNLSHNLLTITNALKADQSTIVVSWLPQYHDMGLIGSYLAVYTQEEEEFTPRHFNSFKDVNNGLKPCHILKAHTSKHQTSHSSYSLKKLIRKP